MTDRRQAPTRGTSEPASARDRSQGKDATATAPPGRRPDLIAEELPLIPFVCESRGTHAVTYISSRVETVTGYRAEEFLADPTFWIDRLHRDDRDRVLVRLRDLPEDNCFEREYRWRFRDGSYHWMLAVLRRVRDVEGPGSHLAGVWMDVSERHRIQQEDRRALELYENIVETVRAPLVVLDGDLRVLSVNRAFCLAFELAEERCVGKLLPDIGNGEWEIPELQRLLTEILPGDSEVVDFEVRLSGHPGGHRVLLINARKMYRPGNATDTILLAIEDATVRRRVDELRQIEQVRLEQQLDRQQREIRDYEAQLATAQRLEAIGRLAGGVAHDFNNMLSVILGYAELALSQLQPDQPAAREALEHVLNAGKRSAELTRKLLAFGRQQLLEPEVVDLNEIVAETERLLARAIGEDVTLHCALADDRCPVYVDRSQMEQAIMNLVINARDAMPHGGRLQIETGYRRLDATALRDQLGVEPGRYVELAISDSGCGMDADTLSHIFEPFFTTKGETQGTGLGLASLHGFVAQSGGAVRVFSEIARGTTFKIYLPLAAEAPGGTTPHLDGEPLGVTVQCETVLLVEDNELVRDLLMRLLTEDGFTVLEAADGRQALDLAQRHAGRIDLLITDTVMPGMGGHEVARRLTEIRPDTRILLMSGYKEASAQEDGGWPGETAFIAKPFSPATMRRKIRDVLAGS